jgi:uncharacterized protein
VTLDEIKHELAVKGIMRLKVKVTPKAGRCEIQGFLADGTLKARVRAAPERGKANAELCELVARGLGLKPAQVTVLSGAASPQKTILLRS